MAAAATPAATPAPISAFFAVDIPFPLLLFAMFL
jgi:hypothetical protein